MEQGDRHREEASCVWRAEFLADGSRAAAVFTENTWIFTYLGLSFGKHRKRQFMTRGKKAGFDNRHQGTVLPNLSSGCCRWMSHWAGKRSVLIMKLYLFLAVPEIPCRNTDLYCSMIPTCIRTASTHPSPNWAIAVPNQSLISLAALWPRAVLPVHTRSIFLLSQREGRIYLHNTRGMWKGRTKKVTCFGLCPWCEAGAQHRDDQREQNLSSQSPTRVKWWEFILNIPTTRFYSARYTPLSAAKAKSSSTDSLQAW